VVGVACVGGNDQNQNVTQGESEKLLLSPSGTKRETRATSLGTFPVPRELARAFTDTACDLKYAMSKFVRNPEKR
jgi:hypothetical protein